MRSKIKLGKQKNKRIVLVEINEIENKFSETKLRDYSDEDIGEFVRLNINDVVDWHVIIDGIVYKSIYSMIDEEMRKQVNAKYYAINQTEVLEKSAKFLDETGEKWEMHVDSLKTLESFTKAVGSKTFAIRSFQPLHNSFQYRVFLEDALDVIRLALEVRGATRDEYEFRLTNSRYKELIVKKNQSMTITIAEFNYELDNFDIDKSTITIIPDVITTQTFIYNVADFTVPLTTLNTNGVDVMTNTQAAIYICQNVICGYDWIGFMEKEGFQLITEFENLFCIVIRQLMDIDETALVFKPFVDQLKDQLMDHEIYEKVNKLDADHLWKTRNACRDVSITEYRATCMEMSTRMFPIIDPVMSFCHARFYWFVGYIHAFFTPNSHEERRFLIRGLSHKCPMNSGRILLTFLNLVTNDWEIQNNAFLSEQRTGLPMEDRNARIRMFQASVARNLFKRFEVSVTSPKSPQANTESLNASEMLPMPVFEKVKPITEKFEFKLSNRETSENIHTMKSKAPEKISIFQVVTEDPTEESESFTKEMDQETIGLKEKTRKMNEKMLKDQEKTKKLEEELEKKKKKNEKLEKELEAAKELRIQSMTSDELEMESKENKMKEVLGRKDRIIEILSGRVTDLKKRAYDSKDPSESGAIVDSGISKNSSTVESEASETPSKTQKISENIAEVVSKNTNSTQITSENSKEPVVSKPSEKSQAKPETLESIAKEPSSTKSGTPKNPPTMTSVILEKSSKPKLTEKTEESKEKDQKMTEEMLKNQEKEEKLEEEMEKKKKRNEILELEVKAMKKINGNDQMDIVFKEEQTKKVSAEKDETIRELRLRIAALNAIRSASSSPVLPEPSTEWQRKQGEFEKIRDDFPKDSIVETATKMIEKFKAVNKQHELADFELFQLEAKIRIYLETVGINIMKIKTTQDCTDLLPLPTYPSLSASFLKEYGKLMNQ